MKYLITITLAIAITIVLGNVYGTGAGSLAAIGFICLAGVLSMPRLRKPEQFKNTDGRLRDRAGKYIDNPKFKKLAERKPTICEIREQIGLSKYGYVYES